jgi:hypothetical protein
MGGHADATLRRIARLADGWLPLGKPEAMRPLVERLRLYAQEAGRDPAQIGLEAMVNSREGQPDDWVRQIEAWRELGQPILLSVQSVEALHRSASISRLSAAIRRSLSPDGSKEALPVFSEQE